MGKGTSSNRTDLRWAMTFPVAAAALLAITSCGSNKAEGPEQIGTASSSMGTYLTADEGKSVYMWEGDTGSGSNCSGACTDVWKPVTTTGAPTASGSAMASRLGTITRSDGSSQVTYSGHPLYYYSGDTKAGDTAGEGVTGFGAKWWLVTTQGMGLMESASMAPSPSMSHSSSAPAAPPAYHY